MKLKQLQEARYAGDHPIVIDIKKAIAYNEPVDVVMDSQRAVAAIEGIVKAFGEPQVDEEGMEGMNTLMRWDLPGNRLQVIIQSDRTIIEMFAFGENTKSATSSLMQRMQRRRTR